MLYKLLYIPSWKRHLKTKCLIKCEYFNTITSQNMIVDWKNLSKIVAVEWLAKQPWSHKPVTCLISNTKQVFLLDVMTAVSKWVTWNSIDFIFEQVSFRNYEFPYPLAKGQIISLLLYFKDGFDIYWPTKVNMQSIKESKTTFIVTNVYCYKK